MLGAVYSKPAGFLALGPVFLNSGCRRSHFVFDDDDDLAAAVAQAGYRVCSYLVVVPGTMNPEHWPETRS
jgi:hypothetical protein